MRLPRLENLDLEPFWSDDIDNSLAIRHNLLFASIRRTEVFNCNKRVSCNGSKSSK